MTEFTGAAYWYPVAAAPVLLITVITALLVNRIVRSKEKREARNTSFSPLAKLSHVKDISSWSKITQFLGTGSMVTSSPRKKFEADIEAQTPALTDVNIPKLVVRAATIPVNSLPLPIKTVPANISSRPVSSDVQRGRTDMISKSHQLSPRAQSETGTTGVDTRRLGLSDFGLMQRDPKRHDRRRHGVVDFSPESFGNTFELGS